MLRKSLFNANGHHFKPPRFLSVWTVLSFIIVVVALFIYFFPKQDLLKRLDLSYEGDKVTRQYIRNLILIYPHDKNLQLLLAGQDIYFGQSEKALAVIAPYLKKKPQSRLEWRAQWFFYQLLRTMAYDKELPTSVQQASRQKMRHAITQLVQGPYALAQLLQLANDAIALDDAQLGLVVFQKILKDDFAHSVELYAKVAKLALSLGRYRDSAYYYFQAQQHTHNIDKKRHYFMLAIKSYQQANLLNEALDKAQQYLGILSTDPKTLTYLVELALAAGKPEVAAKYNAMVFPLHEVKP